MMNVLDVGWMDEYLSLTFKCGEREEEFQQLPANHFLCEKKNKAKAY
jgi:hypothetical protein